MTSPYTNFSKNELRQVYSAIHTPVYNCLKTLLLAQAEQSIASQAMGKLIEFFIGFNSNRVVYYPGELLQGYVIVNLQQPMEMRGIKLELEGDAKCHWTEQEGSGDNRRTEHYRGHEKLIDYGVWLFNDGHSKVSHNAGRFSYQFSFQLPPGLPSSFEGSHGHIRYILKAKIDRPWKFDPKTKRPLILNEVIDTNLIAYARGPGGEKSKEVGCFCCAGPLHLAGSIDRACYCPGEAVLVNANVENSTTRNMNALKGKVVQTIIYVSTRKSKHNSKTVSRIDGPAILKGNHANWQNQPLPVPACPPTINCNVIRVQYHVEIEVDVPWGFDATLKLPITMGTVPYRATYGQPAAYPPLNQPVQNEFAPNPMPPMVDPNTPYPPSMNAALPPPPPQLLGYPDMAPPSYAAAVGDQAVNTADDDDKHTFGDMSYLPVYTYAQPHQNYKPPPPGAPPAEGPSQPYPPPPPAGGPAQPYPAPPPAGGPAQPYPPPPGMPPTGQPQVGFAPPGYRQGEPVPTAPEKQ